jgi:hypothetical protein
MTFGNQPLLVSKDPNVCNQKVATDVAFIQGLCILGNCGVLLSDGTGALSRLLLRKTLKFVHLGRGVSMEKWSAVIVSAMGRFNRVVAADIPHHVTQRGNGRRFILDCDADRAVY